MVDTSHSNNHTDTPISDPPHRLTFEHACLNHPPTLQSKTTDVLSFMQLNCYVSKEITLTLLNHSHTTSIIILQEPWVNPFTLLPPAHADWHLFAGYEHRPSDWKDRHKSCIYVRKSIPSEALIRLPTNSKHLLSLQLRTSANCSLTLVNVYNPPRTNEGLKDLSHWLDKHNDRSTPMCLFMDSNLHHCLWNLPGYLSTHWEAANLIKVCRRHSFCLTSPTQIPTFYLAKGKGTTIDLIWSNFKVAGVIANFKVSEEN